MYTGLTEAVDTGPLRIIIDLDKMDASERLIIQDFMKMVQWQSSKFISSGTPCVSITFRYLGYVTGVCATTFAIPYGYQFGAEKLGISNEDVRKALGVLFSSVGTISLAALVSRVTGNSWGSATLPIGPEKRAVVRASSRAQRNTDRALTVMFSLLGGLSATPTVLLTHNFFVKISPELAGFLDLLTLLGYGSLRTWALKKVTTNLYKQIKKAIFPYRPQAGTIAFKRQQLIGWLKESISIIRSASDQGLQPLYEIYLRTDVKQFDRGELLRYAASTTLLQFNVRKAPSLESVGAYQEPIIRKIMGYIGYPVGILAAYPALPIGMKASKTFWDWATGTDDSSLLDASNILVGSVSWASVGALNGISTSSGFEKLFDALSLLFTSGRALATRDRLCCLISVLNVIMLLFAVCSSTPRTDITIEYQPGEGEWYGKLMVACTAISAVLLDFWALTGWVEEKVRGSSERGRLTGQFNENLSVMGDLDDGVVESLHHQVALNRDEHHIDEEGTTVQASGSDSFSLAFFQRNTNEDVANYLESVVEMTRTNTL